MDTENEADRDEEENSTEDEGEREDEELDLIAILDLAEIVNELKNSKFLYGLPYHPFSQPKGIINTKSFDLHTTTHKLLQLNGLRIDKCFNRTYIMSKSQHAA